MADAFGKRAVPSAALDIEFGAGGDELLDHECVAVRRGQDERSEPAEKPRELSVDSAKPNPSAQGPYPLKFWTSRAAPAAMSCSTTSVWPSNAAPMSAVLLQRQVSCQVE
jgi:hypothetical protein